MGTSLRRSRLVFLFQAAPFCGSWRAWKLTVTARPWRMDALSALLATCFFFSLCQTVLLFFFCQVKESPEFGSTTAVVLRHCSSTGGYQSSSSVRLLLAQTKRPKREREKKRSQEKQIQQFRPIQILAVLGCCLVFLYTLSLYIQLQRPTSWAEAEDSNTVPNRKEEDSERGENKREWEKKNKDELRYYTGRWLEKKKGRYKNMARGKVFFFFFFFSILPFFLSLFFFFFFLSSLFFMLEEQKKRMSMRVCVRVRAERAQRGHFVFRRFLPGELRGRLGSTDFSTTSRLCEAVPDGSRVSYSALSEARKPHTTGSAFFFQWKTTKEEERRLPSLKNKKLFFFSFLRYGPVHRRRHIHTYTAIVCARKNRIVVYTKKRIPVEEYMWSVSFPQFFFLCQFSRENITRKQGFENEYTFRLRHCSSWQ